MKEFMEVVFIQDEQFYFFPLNLHIPESHAPWFQLNRDQLVEETKATLIPCILKQPRDAAQSEESVFLKTNACKLIYQMFQTRLAHCVLLYNEQKGTALRNCGWEMTAWIIPPEVDIPVEFVSV